MIRYYIKNIEWFPVIMLTFGSIIGLCVVIGGISMMTRGETEGKILVISGASISILMSGLYFSTFHESAVLDARKEMREDEQNRRRAQEKAEAIAKRKEKIERLVMVEGYSFEEAEKRLW